MKIPDGVTVSASGRAKYPRDLAEYGEIYGRTEVAVRSWVRIGKAKGELPPLDNPPEMVLWWGRWMSQRLPDSIETAAIRSKVPDLVLEAQEIEAPAVVVEPVAGETGTLSLEMARDAMESLNRLRSASALYYEKLQGAIEKGDQPQADLWQKQWLAIEEKQRHWERDIGKIEAARGDSVRKADLISALTTLAGTLRRNFVGGMKSFARDVAPNLSDDEIDEYARPHVEDCFRRLRDSELSAALRAA